jgi:hypothetical protein
MEKLENFFGNYKIENIRNIPANSIDGILDYISRYPFYSDLRTIDDLCIKFIAKAKKLISYTLPAIIGISLIPVPGVDDAIAVSFESGLITAIGHTFGENITLANQSLGLSLKEPNISSNPNTVPKKEIQESDDDYWDPSNQNQPNNTQQKSLINI